MKVSKVRSSKRARGRSPKMAWLYTRDRCIQEEVLAGIFEPTLADPVPFPVTVVRFSSMQEYHPTMPVVLEGQRTQMARISRRLSCCTDPKEAWRLVEERNNYLGKLGDEEGIVMRFGLPITKLIPYKHLLERVGVSRMLARLFPVAATLADVDPNEVYVKCSQVVIRDMQCEILRDGIWHETEVPSSESLQLQIDRVAKLLSCLRDMDEDE